MDCHCKPETQQAIKLECPQTFREAQTEVFVFEAVRQSVHGLAHVPAVQAKDLSSVSKEEAAKRVLDKTRKKESCFGVVGKREIFGTSIETNDL